MKKTAAKPSNDLSPPSSKPKPVSPILDEAQIVETLSMPVDPMSSNEYLRTASMLSAVDAHDRQLQRSAVVQIIARAFTLNENLRMLEMLSRLRIDLESGEHPIEFILESLKHMQALKLQHAEEGREKLLHDMKLTIQCAWENDPIN